MYILSKNTDNNKERYFYKYIVSSTKVMKI